MAHIMITFVTFHVDFDKSSAEYLENSQVLRKKNILLNLTAGNREFDHMEMIGTMFKSARLFHPRCKCIILSDQKTDFSGIEGVDVILRYDIDPRKLILSRLIAQIAFLKTCDVISDVVFLDSDIIVNSNLENVFEKDFDVALTYRESKKRNMPINGGVLFVSGRRKEKVLEFFEMVYSIYIDKYAHHDVWWGDQLALMDALGVEDIKNKNVLDVDGVTVCLLSCGEYNYYPPHSYRSILSELKNKKILHFKDKRKNMMQLYWNIYLAERETGERKMFSAMKHKPLLLILIIKEMLLRLLRGGR